MWKWYLKLGHERACKVRAASEDSPCADAEVIDPESPEEVEQAVMMLKAMLSGTPQLTPTSGNYIPTAKEAERIVQMLKHLKQ